MCLWLITQYRYKVTAHRNIHPRRNIILRDHSIDQCTNVHNCIVHCKLDPLEAVHVTQQTQSQRVASFTKEVNQRLANRPLVFNGRLANRGSTPLVKEATGDCSAANAVWGNLRLWQRALWVGVSNLPAPIYWTPRSKSWITIQIFHWSKSIWRFHLQTSSIFCRPQYLNSLRPHDTYIPQ